MTSFFTTANIALFQLRLQPIGNCEEWTVSSYLTVHLYVYTFMYVHVYTYAHSYVYAYMCVCMYVLLYVCEYMFVCIWVLMHVCTWMCIKKLIVKDLNFIINFHEYIIHMMLCVAILLIIVVYSMFIWKSFKNPEMQPSVF